MKLICYLPAFVGYVFYMFSEKSCLELESIKILKEIRNFSHSPILFLSFFTKKLILGEKVEIENNKCGL